MTESTSAPVQAQAQPSTPQKQGSSAAGSKKKTAGAKNQLHHTSRTIRNTPI